jgi:hypothetical protein
MKRFFLVAMGALLLASPLLAQPPQLGKDEASVRREIELPSIRKATKLLPKEYQGDGVTNDEIRKNPDKYPLRFAVLAAVDSLRKQYAEGSLPEEFRAPDPKDRAAAMKRILESQRPLARQMADLKEQQERLEGLTEERKKESSKRWQAHYDYIMAHVLLRSAYLFEYSLMLGKVRKDELPELDANEKHTGWRLAPAEQMSGPAEIKDLVKSANKLLRGLAKDHAGTPWADLADRDLNTPLGLHWEAAVVAAPPMPPKK